MQKPLSRFLALVAAASLVLNAGIASAAARKPVPGAAPTQVMGTKKSHKIQTLQSTASAMSQSTAKASMPTPAKMALFNRAQLNHKRNPVPASRPDEMILKYKPGVTITEAAAIRGSVKAQTVRKFGNGAELVKLPKGSSVLAAAASLKRGGKVEYAEPNYVVRKLELTPTDGFMDFLWGMKNTGANLPWDTGTSGVDIKATHAWEITTGDPDLVIGVIDTGIDFDHPDLQQNAWVNHGEFCGDGQDNDQNGYIDDCNGFDFFHWDGTVYDPEPIDENFDGVTDYYTDLHGTHVAGTIAAAMNDFGVVGVAPDVKVMSLKFLGPDGSGDVAGAIAAIDYAAQQGVRILNNSWGGYAYSQALADAIAARPEILFVAAAGNEAFDMDDADPSTPVSYPGGLDMPNILTVAAVDNDGNLAEFSNYGALKVDVAAPGVDILSSGPALRHAGAGVANHGFNYKSLYLGFGLSDLATADRAPFLQRALSELGVGTADPIYVVLDDESSIDSQGTTYPAVKPALEAALTGYTNVTYQPVLAAEDGPILNAAITPVVIWATGYAMGLNHPEMKTLSDNDLSNIDQYLQSGGRLLLMGQDALLYSENSPVVTQRMGVKFLSEGDPRMTLAGVTYTGFDGVTYTLAAPQGQHYRDSVTATAGVSGAREVLTWTPDDDGEAFWFMGGTSMASPHVAGVAALLKTANPDWTTQQLKSRIMSTVNVRDNLRGKMVEPGIVDAFRALSYSVDNDVPGVTWSEWGKTHQGTLDGELGSDLDDVFKVHLRAGEEIRIRMQGEGDFDLYLFNHNTTTVNDIGYLLDASENWGFGLHEEIVYRVTEEADYYVDVFAYQGRGNYTLTIEWGNGPRWYEEFDPALKYSTGWTNPFGFYQYSSVAGATMTFKFYGDIVELGAIKNPNMGLATITLDTLPPQDVDLFAPVEQPAIVYRKDGLDRTVEHTLTIRNKGMRSPMGRKTAIGVSVDFVNVMLDNAFLPPVTQVWAYNGSGKVELEWPKSHTQANFAGYKVYRADGPGAPWKAITGVIPANQLAAKPTVNLVKGSSTSNTAYYLDTTVQNGRDYFYYVTPVTTKGMETPPEAGAFVVQAHPDLAPAPVAELSVGAGDAHVFLNWRGNTEPDMMAYDIFRSTGTAPMVWLADVPHYLGQEWFSWTDSTVTNEQDYTYYVFARDNWGVRSESATPKTAHPSAPPADVTGFTGTMSRENGIVLTWDPAQDASYYLVYEYGPTEVKKYKVVGATTLTIPTSDFTRDYEFEIRAFDQWGVGSMTSAWTMVYDTVGPLAVTGLSAEALDGAVELTWNFTEEQDLDGWEIEAQVNGTTVRADFAGRPAPGSTSMEYLFTGLNNGQTYEFVVTPLDYRSNRGPSGSVNATPASSLPAPVLDLVDVGDNLVNLSWSAVAEADHYRLTRSSGQESPVSFDVYGTSFVDEGLVNGVAYTYQVATVDAAGNMSAFSNVVTAAPIDTVKPGTPGNFRVTGEINSVSLAWDPVTDADLYRYIIFRSVNGAPYQVLATLLPDATTYFDTTCSLGDTCSYFMLAKDDDSNQSSDTPFVTARPHDGVAPVQPSDLWNLPQEGGVVKLVWTPSTSADVVEYVVRQKDSYTGEVVMVYSAPTATNVDGKVVYSVTGLMDQATYYFTVTAKDWTGYESSVALFTEATPGAGPLTMGTYASSNGRITYTGGWATSTGAGHYLDHYRWSEVPQASVEVLFDGNQVTWYGNRINRGGLIDVYLDGTKVTTVDTHSTTDEINVPVYVSPILGMGQHTLKLVLVGVNPTTGYSGGILQVEAFKVDSVDVPPAAPTGVEAVAGDGSVTITWNAVNDPDLSGYNVYRTDADLPLNPNPLTTLNYEDHAVVNGSSYTYYVTAVDLSGLESPNSAFVTATPTAADRTPPAPATNLSASAGNQQITLGWTPSDTPSDVATYRIWMGTGASTPGNADWSLVGESATTTFTVSALTNGTTYWFKVVAADRSGNQASDSNVVFAMPNAGGVMPGLVENSSSSISFVGSWSIHSHSKHSGGTIHYSGTTGAEARLVFQGTGITWTAYNSPSYGIAKVYLDGVEAGTVDLYALSATYAVPVFSLSGLSSGVHEIKIVRTGSKNPSASGAFLNIDAFQVQ